MSDVQNTAPNNFDWRVILSPWTLSAFALVLVAVLDPANLGPVTGKASKALLGTLPFILFAVGLIAYLKAAGAESLIANAFKGREVTTIFFAAAFGGLAPFCSCEVIPFIAAMLALGAPLSAIMAFWLASPLIDPPSLIITASALGWDFAIAKTITAVGIGLLGGFFVLIVARMGFWADAVKPQKQSSCCCGPSIPSGAPMWAFWKESARTDLFKAEAKTNFMFLLKWLMLAYVLEGLMIAYVPSDLIVTTVGGDGIGAIILAAVVGMPAYLNSFVAAPLLGGLVDQGMQPGAALAFMTAGAVSSIPAMAAVWSLVKPSVFTAYISLGLTGAIIAGVTFQMI